MTMSTCCESIKCLDDTTIWEAFSITNSNSQIQLTANQATMWCHKNNTEKTKEMIIYFDKKSPSFPFIQINDNDLYRVSRTKLLGLIINKKLTWGDHVDYLCKKLLNDYISYGYLKEQIFHLMILFLFTIASYVPF